MQIELHKKERKTRGNKDERQGTRKKVCVEDDGERGRHR